MSRKNSLLVIITLFFLAMVSSFVFRDALLNYFVCRKQAAMLDRYDVSLEIKKCGFEGIRDIYIENLSLVPVGLDKLLYISKVKAKLNLAMLFRFKIGFNELLVDTILVNAMKYDNGLNNYSMLFKGAKKRHCD